MFRSIPRADTKALLTRFGTFAEVPGAPLALLQEVKGVGPSVALDLKIIAAAGQRAALSEIAGREICPRAQNRAPPRPPNG